MSLSDKKKGVTIIAAAAENNALGKDNKLIWHLSEDLKRFKKLTYGHAIIMGRKTFESMPMALPKRRNIIITRNKFYLAKGAEVCNSIEEALSIVKDDLQPFIIGGGEIYRQSMELVDRIELTRIHEEFNADTFFPNIPETKWKLISENRFLNSSTANLSYSYLTYIRKS
ncbi:MAG: dihydrofolate reductase [Flavobacteriaceae bacterium]|nr:dihydrofolate reductase [Flavobacteriaceae bacterium]